MKRNKLFILGICTVMVALVSLSLVSGTWAKYTSSVSASDSARVAKWAWTYEGDDVLNTFSFDIFNTAYTEDNVDTDGLLNDSVVIAPGTTGSVTFGFKNASEVNAKYTITFKDTINADSIPVQFRLATNGGAAGEWKDTIAELNLTDVACNMTEEVEYTIEWRWAFEGGSGTHDGQTDGTDTALGISGTATYGVEVKVVFTQVD